jgi:transcription elongation factor Elf1
MDVPKNRMQEVKKRPEVPTPQQAPPVVVLRRVMPCTCPCCGKAQSPRVLRTCADKNEALVSCGACGKSLVYYYATEENPVPRVRPTRPRSV